MKDFHLHNVVHTGMYITKYILYIHTTYNAMIDNDESSDEHLKCISIPNTLLLYKWWMF